MWTCILLQKLYEEGAHAVHTQRGIQMPRGVYDRAKAKPRGAAKAEKVEASAPEAPVQKRKYTRRASTVSAPVASTSNKVGSIATLKELVNIRSQFATGGPSGGGQVLSKLDALISAEADALLPKAEVPVAAPAIETKEHKTRNGKVPSIASPVDPASIPGFNPPPPPVQQ
jgi:hypothetical protein